MIMDWLTGVVRWLFFMLDGVIYSFIVTVYNLFVDIAETSIFTEEVIDLFASKVYALLGIFMLFKVSFSILSYIVSPDDFLDKTKGFSKLISNIIITLTLLIVTPWIFTQAMDIQRIVLRDNIIGKIFSTTEINTTVVTDPGATMAYQTLKAFYHLDTDAYSECTGLETGTIADRERCKEVGFNNADNFDSMEQSLVYAYNTNSVSLYMDGDLLNQKASDDGYTMNYMFLISTLAGGAICLLLIVFCFDVAVRSVKLGFLRMIAPIPIISRIDPKSSKDGPFNKWVKTCISTYLDLFIRLLAIYFAVFVITQMMDLRFVDAVTGLETDVNAFVKVFIILGALLFAKQLPKLIEDLTGLKMSGKFTLNPLKKLNQTGIPGLAAVGAAGALGFASNMAEAKNRGSGPIGFMKRVGSGVAGASSSMFHTGQNVLKNKGEKNFSSLRSGVALSSNNRRLREGGYGFVAKAQDTWTDMSGHKFSTGTTSKLKDEVNNMEINLQNIKQSEEAARRTFYDSLSGTSENVRKYFDFGIKVDDKGKFIGYNEKSLDGFLQSSGVSRDSLSTEEINVFNNILSNYNSVTRLDTDGRKLEKDIKDKREQIDNSKQKPK
mgnify:CR=1 FL=1